MIHFRSKLSYQLRPRTSGSKMLAAIPPQEMQQSTIGAMAKAVGDKVFTGYCASDIEMATPQLTLEQIGRISAIVAQYIADQRRRFWPQAEPLTAAQRAAMEEFFTPELLDTVRMLVLSGVRVENPPFYPMLANWGLSKLPDLSRMTAITFSDVVVSIAPCSDRLLFHELVHVEQYRQLGIPRFAELCVRGFLMGGSYEAIPLEVDAYTLERTFQQQPHCPFSVEDKVKRWVATNRF